MSDNHFRKRHQQLTRCTDAAVEKHLQQDDLFAQMAPESVLEALGYLIDNCPITAGDELWQVSGGTRDNVIFSRGGRQAVELSGDAAAAAFQLAADYKQTLTAVRHRIGIRARHFTVQKAIPGQLNMNTQDDLTGINLRPYRLDGRVISLGCLSCTLRTECGGQTRTGGGWSCETRCSQCNTDTCDLICLGKPNLLAKARVEVRSSFGWQDIGPISSPQELPRYIPTIHHGSRRNVPLKTDWAAIPLTRVLRRLKSGDVRLVAELPKNSDSNLAFTLKPNFYFLGSAKMNRSSSIGDGTPLTLSQRLSGASSGTQR